MVQLLNEMPTLVSKFYRFMNKSSAKIALLSLVVALLVPTLGHAQDTNAARGTTNSLPNLTPASRPLPLHGTVAAVNTAAMTLTVGDSVLAATSKTRIVKANKAATLSDIKVGDVVNVSYLKVNDGTLRAITIRVVVRPAVKPRQPNDASATPTPHAPAQP